jgi:hypothetical protein
MKQVDQKKQIDKRKPYSFYIDDIPMQLLKKLKEDQGVPLSTSINRAIITYYVNLISDQDAYQMALKKLSRP